MSKIYYGDENNTAVELNIGVSQEYVDSQIEAVSADIHSIPAGGTAGQVLGKSSDADYEVQWVDQSGGGSDPDAIKKDGTTVTVAPIPFAKGATFCDRLEIYDVAGQIDITPIDKYSTLTFTPGDAVVIGRYKNEFDKCTITLSGAGLEVNDGSSAGTTGQVLTAKGDGKCEWADAAGWEQVLVSRDNEVALYKNGDFISIVLLVDKLNMEVFSVRSTAAGLYWFNGSDSWQFPGGGEYSGMESGRSKPIPITPWFDASVGQNFAIANGYIKIGNSNGNLSLQTDYEGLTNESTDTNVTVSYGAAGTVLAMYKL